MGRRALAGALLALALAGCAQPAEEVASPGRTEPHCPATVLPPGPGTGTVPADLAVAWVLRCRDDMRLLPGEGRWAVRVEERADTDATALLAALRRPDATATGDTMCPSIKIELPYFALVGVDGRVVVPRAPVGPCGGNPQPAVGAALNALPFREVGMRRLNQDVSQESLDTGCGQVWFDARLGAYGEKPAPARPFWRKKPDSLQVCLWEPRPKGYPRLVASGTVTGTELTALLTRLGGLPAARPCRAAHRSFVVIQYVRRHWYDDGASAELDGCRHVERPDHTLGQLDPATAALLGTLARR